MTCLVIVGCGETKSPDAEKQSSIEKPDSSAGVDDSISKVEKLCFLNVHPYKNPPPGYEKAADYDQLEITIAGKKVYGIYNWLPYEKDSRQGSFVGTIQDKTITATYVYVQEGAYTGIEIEITLADTYARVSSKELGSIDIAKVTCNDE